jgi:hypothetical protein
LSRDVAARAGFDAEPFVRVVRHVRGTDKIGSSDVSAVLAGMSMECTAWLPTSTATKRTLTPTRVMQSGGNPLGMEDALCVRI